MSENLVESRESFQYGELWPDGTFKALSKYEHHARTELDRTLRSDYTRIPETLRPVFGSRKVITTTETFPPEEIPA